MLPVTLKMHTKTLNPIESLFCSPCKDVTVAEFIGRHNYNSSIFVLQVTVMRRSPLSYFPPSNRLIAAGIAMIRLNIEPVCLL